MSTRRRLAAATALLACLAGVLTGCGDDDDSGDGTTTTEADGTTTESTAGDGGEAAAGAEVCDAYADITVAFSGPPPDPATLTPLLDTLESGAPEEIAEQVGVMTTAARSVLDSNGEDFSAFEAPEFAEAQSEVDPYMFENCEFDEKVEVTAADYSFDGIPTELPAGRVAFLLTNEGNEPHEMALARKKDGVTESWDEILALPEDQAMEKIDQAGGAFAPGQGDQGLAIAELEAGEYVAVCFIPVGTSIDDTGEHPGDGPPHFTQGMKSEFTVA